MNSASSRRDFLKQTTLAGVGFWAAGGLEAAQTRQVGPNDRVNIAIVGAGGRGREDLNALVKTGIVNVVALCDVDDARAAASFNDYPKVPKFADFRVMLEKQRDIDAVVVATPDHTHAHISIAAMRMGKHLYCEKPLCHSIYECRLMKETAQKNKVATQMGNQGTANNNLRRAAEIVQSGGIGDVREVHVWTNRPGMYWRQNLSRPKDTPPVPKTLNWDLWLGPAPQRPYNAAYLPFSWRGWWDFGTGALGDMACHIMNLPFMALRLGYPTAVSAELDTPANAQSPPNGCRVTYEFPARGKMPALTLHWYEVRRPPNEAAMGQMLSGGGSLLVGSRGTLYSSDDYGRNVQLLPAAQFQGFQDPKPTIPRAPGQNHHREWLDAIRGGRPATSNFVDYAALLAEVVLLGNVALRVGGKRVVWNAEKMEPVGMAEAGRLIRREYRKGWNL